MSKKSSKDQKQKKPVAAKTKPTEELSEEQLEGVAGGASRGQLLDKSTAGTPSESLSLNFSKISVEYKPQ